jgi:alpha-beta hydrolase superfamily lysophospholipase
VHGPIDVTFDVSDHVGLGERCRIGASLFAPDDVPDTLTAVVAVPGGTYTRRYWDLRFPGHDHYSFVAYLTRLGFVVLALDNLGTGASTRPTCADDVTFATAAAANAAVAAQFSEQIQAGEFAPLIAPPARLRLAGVGHSLGGQLTAVQQATHHSYERIALLGSSFRGFFLFDTADEAAATKLMASMVGDTWDAGYLEVDPGLTRNFFHAGDVPEDVLAADDAFMTVLPRKLGVDAMAPTKHQPTIAGIDVPVFLTFAEVDSSPDPSAEVACYPNSTDVTLFRLPGSAHNHNHATTRHILWDRLAHWLNYAATSTGPVKRPVVTHGLAVPSSG